MRRLNHSAPREAVRAVAFLNIHFVMQVPNPKLHTATRTKGNAERYNPHAGLGPEELYTGLMVLGCPSIVSAHFPSAINLEQMSCSEWLLINYVRPHMLGSRS